jgi:hypothetical protein
MFLACHVVAPLSSHPFDIASFPSDGRIEFVVRAKRGATKKFFKYAEKACPNFPSNSSPQNVGRSVLIDGCYATIRPLETIRFLGLLGWVDGSSVHHTFDARYRAAVSGCYWPIDTIP